MTPKVLSVLIVASFFAPSLAAQQPRDNAAAHVGHASLSGVVTVDDPAGRPLRRAIVTVTSAELRQARVVLTDDAGRFTVTGLVVGRYGISASKPAYVTRAYGQRRAGVGSGVSISIADGQQLTGLEIRLPRGAVLAGIVRDETGQPRQGMQVSALQWRMINGERTLMNVATTGPLGPGGTDARGAYRIFGLTAGDYVIAVSPPIFESLPRSGDLREVTERELQWAAAQLTRSGRGVAAPAPSTSPAPPAGRIVGAVPVFHPGVLDAAQATTIHVEAGEERPDVDVTTSFAPMARIEGVIRAPDGQPATNTQITLAGKSGGVARGISSSSFMRPGADGTFLIPNVAPGTYTLTVVTQRAAPARGTPPPVAPSIATGEWAALELTIDGQDQTGIALQLQPGMTMSGRLTFDGGALPAPDMTTIRVGLASLTPTPSPGSPNTFADADGTFELSGLTPGRYRLTATLPPGAPSGPAWTLRSVVAGGREIADMPVDVRAGESLSNVVITFSDRAAEVSGTLLDGAGRPTPDYYVLLFSTNKDQWLQGSRRVPSPRRPATDGAFRFTGLPAGEYYIAAVTEVDPQQLYDAMFLEQIASSGSALTISLKEGEARVQALKVAGP